MLQVGVDCEEISRFRRLPYGKNKKFYRKIFTRSEIEYCTSFRDPYPRFTARFAAKEAAIKALNSIVSPFYADIEVRKSRKNQPKLFINRKKFKGMAGLAVSLSLAHSDASAIAFVVVAEDKKSIKKAGQRLKKYIPALSKKIGR